MDGWIVNMPVNLLNERRERILKNTGKKPCGNGWD